MTIEASAAGGGCERNHDQSGNCTIIDAPDFQTGLMGTVSGNTITGSSNGAGISFTFSMTRTVADVGPLVMEFAADPPVVRRGQATTLRWTVFNANAVSIDHGVGSRQAVGSAAVSVASTTTYTLTGMASNGMTNTAQATVIVSGRRRAVRH